MVEFCKSGQLPDFLTSTQRLQEWNKPRPRKIDPIPVLELTSRRKELLRAKGSPPTQYDPHPSSLRDPDPMRLEKLRTDLLQLNCPSCLSQLLRAPVKVALHHHHYAASSVYGVVAAVTNHHSVVEKLRLRPCAENCVENSRLKQAKLSLNVTCEERMLIEQNTRTQIQSPEWFAMRARRITGSKCGKILCQNERTVAQVSSTPNHYSTYLQQ